MRVTQTFYCRQRLNRSPVRACVGEPPRCKTWHVFWRANIVYAGPRIRRLSLPYRLKSYYLATAVHVSSFSVSVGPVLQRRGRTCTRNDPLGDAMEHAREVTVRGYAWTIVKCIALAGALLISAVPESAHAQSFVGRYGPVKSPQYVSGHQALQRIRFLENLAALLSQLVTLPRQVVLTVGECREANAFYSPQHKAIVLCHELLAQVSEGIQRDFARIATSEEIANASAGGVTFILMHELGHALIHLLDLPVLGREEDAADQIGTFFLLNSDTAPYALAGALWFFRSSTLIYTRRHFSDEHSVGPQRQSNLACWALGRDPDRYQYLLRGGYLTRERAIRCGAEYSRLDSSVRRLLGNNVRFSPR